MTDATHLMIEYAEADSLIIVLNFSHSIHPTFSRLSTSSSSLLLEHLVRHGESELGIAVLTQIHRNEGNTEESMTSIPSLLSQGSLGVRSLTILLSSVAKVLSPTPLIPYSESALTSPLVGLIISANFCH